MLLWTFICKFLYGYIFSMLLGIHLGVELLDCLVTPCLAFWGTSISFSTELCHFIFPPVMYEGSNSVDFLCNKGIVWCTLIYPFSIKQNGMKVFPSLLLYNSWKVFHCIMVSGFTYFPVNGHPVCFQFLKLSQCCRD